MIMFILTINYVVLFYYEMILYAVVYRCCYISRQKITYFLHSHEAFSTLPKFESNGSYFRSEYQSNKEYMPFLPVLIKLKSRENNNLIFII